MYQALPSRLHVKDSPIAGQGIFALEEIPAGMVLGMSHIAVSYTHLTLPTTPYV